MLDGKIDEAEYQRVFAEIEQDRPYAPLVGAAGVNVINRATIVELAAKHRLPAMYTLRDFVEIGGLMAYSFDPEDMARSCAEYELSLNLKAAKSLGIEFPATLLVSAKFVVE